MGQTPAGEPQAPKTLADKINYLYTVVRPEGQQREFTLPEVRDALAGLGCKVSTSYLSQLRRGAQDNPSRSVLEGLARFFGVSVAYFFDGDEAVAIEQELELLLAMRDGSVRDLALRASTLTGPERELLIRIAQQMGEQRQEQATKRTGRGKSKPASE